ncbi:MAG: Uncharacterized protein G01um10148_870 [Parcubacteria group bacterium Gr01-1014_8]|nr:MAG: Uncharacterized protein G01um10148_870 [Parcubacteria group bacterium Gr01-1014_8]
MLSGAFFFFIVIAVLSYGIQGSLQTTFARKYDAFVVTLYRNLSLIITMAPVLLLVPPSQIIAIREHLGTLMLASGLGAISLLLALSSSKYLPIGVSTALRQVIQVSVSLMLGIVLLNEWLTFHQFLLLLGIVFSAIALALSRADFPHLDPRMVWKGLGLTIVAGLIVAHSFYFFSVLSRAVNPLVAGYFWEVGVGVFALAYFLILSASGTYKAPAKIPFSDAAKILGIALLTILGTSCSALAFNLGPYALASGLTTMTTFVAVIMGWIIYKEHLTKFQIGLIVVAVGLMFLLKVLS